MQEPWRTASGRGAGVRAAGGILVDMKTVTAFLAMAAVLFVVSTCTAHAGGQAETRVSTSVPTPAKTPAAEDVTALTILVIGSGGGGTSAPALSARLPMEIPPYLWNRFTVTDGMTDSSADAQFREVGSSGVTRERVGDLELERIELRVATPRGAAARSTNVQVSFDLSALLDSAGAVRLQPGQYALMLAMGQSGKKSGQARVISVTRVGAQGFTAEVLLR